MGLADRYVYDLHNINNKFYVKKSDDKIKKYNVKPNTKKYLNYRINKLQLKRLMNVNYLLKPQF